MIAPSEKEQLRRNDPRSAQVLIEIALTETDENAAWEAINVMQSRVSREDFEAACALCHSRDATERRLGADILGQFGYPTRAYPEETTNTLISMIGNEGDPDALYAIILALHHQMDPRAVRHIVPFKDHVDSDVRWGVAMNLGLYDDRDC